MHREFVYTERSEVFTLSEANVSVLYDIPDANYFFYAMSAPHS